MHTQGLNDHVASLCVTCGQHVVFLDWKYSYKSVVTQISHDVGFSLISGSDRKFFPHRGLIQHASRRTIPKQHILNHETTIGGLGVKCSPRDPRFAGLSPTEVDRFFQDVNILSTSPPGGTLSYESRV